MKSKGIMIELTALLDVIFIMLFWTMSNAQLENQQIRNEAESKIAEAESEVRKAWETAENINKNAADNQKALDNYRSGEIITVRIIQNSVEISDSTRIIYSGTISEGCFVNALDNAEKNADDVILCSFIYDGNSALYSDVQTINLAIISAEKAYPKFYCTRINISYRKEQQ